MKIFPIIIFFLLNFLIIGVSGDKCFEKFKLFLESSCQGLNYNSTNGCEFINNKCQIKPNCNAAGNNRQMCNSIKLTDNSKKCEIQSNLCTEVTKTCTEYEKGKNNCEYLSSGESNKRCVLDKNGICKAHYNLCNKADQQTCEGNIPNDSSKKCIWKDETCQEVSKTCNEVDFNPHNCLDFPTSDDEKFNCVASIKGCKEQYKNCDLYNNNVNSNDKNKEDCESIIFFGTREKCIYDDENKICTQVNKECKDMLKDSCSDFTPSDSNKRCTRIGDNCEEIFNTCDLYNEFGDKNKEYCEKILPYNTDKNELDNHSKCIFSNNSRCEKKKKSCSEITGDTMCINHELDDENKKCIYIYETHECKEVYKSCSNYKIKNREGCLGIVLYKENGYTINYNQICKYENDVCSIKDLVQCSDYESRLDKEYCTNIHIGENINCAIKDNQCIEHFNSCPENANKETCNSKPLISDTEKCVYNENEGCIKIKKECSEYKGKSSDKCEHLDTKDANKKCFMENGKCVAKYIYCDKYEGNDKATCESIIPFDSEGTISKSNKCVIEGNKCVMKNKECSEAKTYKECFEIKPSDTNKNCIYLNGECKEQYKDCASYNSNGKESIEKDKCESILIMDDDLFRFSKICEFTQGNTNVPNKCEEREKICTDFKVQNLQSMCYYTTELTSVENKCAYFNSNCQEIKKTCSDLYDETSATKEICEAAPTSDSSRKTCVLKEDESGCEEINKQNTNNSKFLVGDKKMINNLLLFIFILFV